MNRSIVECVYDHAINLGEKIALINPNSAKRKMTYRELYCKAYSLANYISSNDTGKEPILVYGHKDPYMIVSFLACVMSGHAYCPVDESMPYERVEMILNQTSSEFVLATENIELSNTCVIGYDNIEKICDIEYESIPSIPETMISEEDTYYIIFTSGSTGSPKGVEISFQALNNFLNWSCTLGEEHPYAEKSVFLNQAPFSFDLSVMDLYTSLYCGSTLCMMDKAIQAKLGDIVPFIRDNGITAVVATPSFVNMCLVDRNFREETIPTLDCFFFCGETLANKTARKLMKRFPNAVIQNAYGPTESTVAVSKVRITQDVVSKYDPLPVGKAKPGTSFIISSYEGSNDGNREIGEIFIVGDTLAKGYFNSDELTNNTFVKCLKDGEWVRAYKTGDIGYIENDQLFYCGRIDLQIKLNGYRIEIGDIESNILKLPFIENCAVIPRSSGGKIKAIVGVIVLSAEEDDTKSAQKQIVEKLGKALPNYMVPQSYEFIKAIPLTNNGKIDRNKLIEIIEED